MSEMTRLEESRAHAVSFMVREIAHVCREMKKRAPGSAGEREAGEYMAKLLRDACGCGDIRMESFTEHPAAFHRYFMFSAVLDCLCAVTHFFCPWLSLGQKKWVTAHRQSPTFSAPGSVWFSALPPCSCSSFNSSCTSR